MCPIHTCTVRLPTRRFPLMTKSEYQELVEFLGKKFSRIDRRFDASPAALPGIADVRLPNPLDLALFSKTCFLHDGEIEFAATA